MQAATGTAIAILAASMLGILVYLGGRVDALSARMDARFDRMDARFDSLGSKLDALGARLDSHIGPHAAG